MSMFIPKPIPFCHEMIQAVFAGKKNCTSRNKRYGYAGEYFFINDKRFVLTKVIKHYLHTIRDCYYTSEGFDTPEEFEAIWNKLHPRKGYCPDQIVWTHFFEEA